MIQAGTILEVHKNSGKWAFVDVGFARDKKSSCILLGEGDPELLTFSNMRERLLDLARQQGEPLNLLLEAPLSVAFTSTGNPTGRKMEKRGSKTRYWYAGLGTAVLLASAYLLRGVFDAKPKRDVRLFEGFVSFKDKSERSDHKADVRQLRDAAWSVPLSNENIYSGDQIKVSPQDLIQSAFLVAGMDFGVPPVIAVEARQQFSR